MYLLTILQLTESAGYQEPSRYSINLYHKHTSFHVYICLLCFSLQKVLGIKNLEEIMESHLVSGKNIMHNCLYINKSGVVTNIDPSGN